MNVILKARELRGRTVVDAAGADIGVVADTWPLDGGGEPELLLLRVGTRFPRLRYLPARRAVLRDDKLHVPWSKLELDDAPSAEDRRWGDPAQVARAYWVTAGDD
jgi:hypothetical protein